MNFQSNSMLIIFGSILAVSIISLVILLLVRSKKMKTMNQKSTTNGMAGEAPMENSAMPTMPATGEIPMQSDISNTMQFTANPFETNSTDINSQNLGANLEATSGIPNEGIMQNPTTSPAMNMASTVNAVPSITPTADLAKPAFNPAGDSPIPSINPNSNLSPSAASTNTEPITIPTPVATSTINPTPVNTTLETVSAITQPQESSKMPEPSMNAPFTTQPAVDMPAMETVTNQPIDSQTPVVASTMQVNSVNSSGLDAAAQPVNPVSTTTTVTMNPVDPAGIFSGNISPNEQIEQPAEVTQTADPQPALAENKTENEDMEISISDLPKPTIPEQIQDKVVIEPNTNMIADLTPDQNLVSPSLNPTPAALDIQLPDISEVNTNPAINQTPTQTNEIDVNPIPAVTTNPSAMATPAELPPLPNMVNSPSLVSQPVTNPVANPNIDTSQPNVTVTNTWSQPIPATQPMAQTTPTGSSVVNSLQSEPVHQNNVAAIQPPTPVNTLPTLNPIS